MIHSEQYALACYRYIEMNPVRAGMVDAPGEYPWSSYRANAYDRGSTWLRWLPQYRALGQTDRARRHAYRELFRSSLEPEQIHNIRACVQTGTPLGNDRFKEQVERALGRSTGHAARGRSPGRKHRTGTLRK